jgi:hypothetical protein
MISLLGLSLAWLRSGAGSIAAPALWFASAVAAGALAQAPAPFAGYAIPVAGAFFGAAFAAAGLDLIQPQAGTGAKNPR